MTSVLLRDRRDTDTQRERPCEDAGTGWRDAATSPGTPGAPRSWERQEGSSPGAAEGARPWDTLISDFQTPDCERINVSAQHVVVRHGHPRTPTQRAAFTKSVIGPRHILGALQAGLAGRLQSPSEPSRHSRHRAHSPDEDPQESGAEDTAPGRRGLECGSELLGAGPHMGPCAQSSHGGGRALSGMSPAEAKCNLAGAPGAAAGLGAPG